MFENNPALTQETVLEATWTDCPEDVQDDIRRLWMDMEFGNDNYYYSWSATDFVNGVESGDVPEYPILAAYLKEKGVDKCLIHYWW